MVFYICFVLMEGLKPTRSQKKENWKNEELTTFFFSIFFFNAKNHSSNLRENCTENLNNAKTVCFFYFHNYFNGYCFKNT